MTKKKSKKLFMNMIIILIIERMVIYFTFNGKNKFPLDTILHLSPLWVSVLLVLMAIYFILDGFNLYSFGKLYNNDYTYSQGFVNSICGTFFSGITPFSSGGQFAQVYIFNKQGISPSNSASILMMAFIVYQTVLVGFTTVIMFFRYRIYRDIYLNFFYLAIVGFIVNVSVICGLFLCSKSKKLQNFLSSTVIKALSKIGFIKNYEETSMKISKSLDNFRTELSNLQNNKVVLIKSTLINFFKLLIIYSIPFFAAKALHLDIPFIKILTFIEICSFVYMITAFVPIPGASGGSEGVYYMLFSPILGKVGTPTTLLIWRFMTYHLGLIIGGLTFATNKDINRLE